MPTDMMLQREEFLPTIRSLLQQTDALIAKYEHLRGVDRNWTSVMLVGETLLLEMVRLLKHERSSGSYRPYRHVLMSDGSMRTHELVHGVWQEREAWSRERSDKDFELQKEINTYTVDGPSTSSTALKKDGPH